MTRKKPPATPRPRFTRLEVNGRPLSAWTRGGSWRPLPVGVPPIARVFGTEWIVLAHTQIYAAPRAGSRCAGMCFGYERIILLESDQPEHEMRDSFQHERVHAAARIYGERDKIIATLGRDREEAVCRFVAAMLTAD